MINCIVLGEYNPPLSIDRGRIILKRYEKIYSYLHCEYGFNIHSIRNNINYALTNRNKNLSIKNFEKVFGYEYYEKNFEPKLFIEEVSSIVKNRCYL